MAEPHRRALTTDKSDKFLLRLPDGMRDQISLEAQKHGRTMNAEVVARLGQSFDRTHSDAYAEELKRTLERSDAYARAVDNLVESLQKTIRAQDLSIVMLTRHLIDLIEGLPKKAQEGPRVAAALKYAFQLGVEQRIERLSKGAHALMSTEQLEALLAEDAQPLEQAAVRELEVPVLVRGKPRIVKRKADGSTTSEAAPASVGKAIRAAAKKRRAR
jgi:hypothetical protein